MVLCIIDSGEDIVQWSSPNLWIVLATTCFEQNEAFGWVLNQRRDDDQLSSGDAGVGIGGRRCAATASKPALVGFDIPAMKEL